MVIHMYLELWENVTETGLFLRFMNVFKLPGSWQSPYFERQLEGVRKILKMIWMPWESLFFRFMNIFKLPGSCQSASTLKGSLRGFVSSVRWFGCHENDYFLGLWTYSNFLVHCRALTLKGSLSGFLSSGRWFGCHEKGYSLGLWTYSNFLVHGRVFTLKVSLRGFLSSARWFGCHEKHSLGLWTNSNFLVHGRVLTLKGSLRRFVRSWRWFGCHEKANLLYFYEHIQTSWFMAERLFWKAAWGGL